MKMFFPCNPKHEAHSPKQYFDRVINLSAFTFDLKKAVYDILQGYNWYVSKNGQILAKHSDLKQIYQQ